MDRAPIRTSISRNQLENTLVMFKSRLQNVKVETDFDPALPPSPPGREGSTRCGPRSSKTRWTP
jgi:hypothetical protein